MGMKKNMTVLTAAVLLPLGAGDGGADMRIFASVENIFDRREADCDLDGRYWMIGVEHHF